MIIIENAMRMENPMPHTITSYFLQLLLIVIWICLFPSDNENMEKLIPSKKQLISNLAIIAGMIPAMTLAPMSRIRT